MLYHRIHIIGYSGTGKTYLAKQLSKILNIKHYDLDDILYKRKYVEKYTDPILKRKLREITKKKTWVIEGTGSRWVHDSFKKADIILVLDAPLHMISWRVIKRHLHRNYIKKLNVKESFLDALKLIKYTHYKKTLPKSHEKSYKSILKPYERKVKHLHTKKQISSFIEGVKRQQSL